MTEGLANNIFSNYSSLLSLNKESLVTLLCDKFEELCTNTTTNTVSQVPARVCAGNLFWTNVLKGKERNPRRDDVKESRNEISRMEERQEGI